MRGSVKLKLLLIGLGFFLFALVAYRNSEGAVYAYEVCILKTYTIECSDGTNNFSTTQYYWDCVTYFGYLYEGGGDGGSSGGGNSNGGGDLDDPGSGGGGGIINPYDKNNDGFIDCYKNTVIRVSGLYISSDCNELRTGPNGSTYYHNAWDITGIGVDGQIIYSASDGVVVGMGEQINPKTGEITGWGYYVMIKDKEGNIWVYAHLKGTHDDPSGIGLTVNTKVTAGLTPIGLCDNSGSSKGPHLHLELQVNGQKTCPDAKLTRC